MDNKKKGKMAALKDLRKMATKMMGDDMDKMKQVSVMAKDKEGLQKGLEMARKVMGEKGSLTDEDMKRKKKKEEDKD